MSGSSRRGEVRDGGAELSAQGGVGGFEFGQAQGEDPDVLGVGGEVARSSSRSAAWRERSSRSVCLRRVISAARMPVCGRGGAGALNRAVMIFTRGER